MLKTVGAVLIIAACSILGIVMSNGYRIRPLQLRSLRSMLNLLETEIIYASTPLPAALEKVARHSAQPMEILLLKTREELLRGDGITAGEAWQNALETIKGQTYLDNEDIAILREFGAGLGGSDKTEQIKNLQLTKELLKHQELKAEQKKSQSERMWRTMGFLTGIALVLVLI